MIGQSGNGRLRIHPLVRPIRYLALMDPDTTVEQVDRLSRDERGLVRSAAAQDRRLPFARVLELMADPASAQSAASNPQVPLYLMHETLDEADVPRAAGKRQIATRIEQHHRQRTRSANTEYSSEESGRSSPAISGLSPDPPGAARTPQRR